MGYLSNRRKHHTAGLPSFPAGTQIVIDASDSGNLSLTGSSVDQIQDISGNNNHVSATGSARPLYTGTAVNGYTSVAFDGVDDVLESAFNAPAINDDDFYLILALHYPSGATSNRCLASASSEGGGVTRGAGWKLTQRTNDDLRYSTTNDTSTADAGLANNVFSANNPYVFAFSVERTGATALQQITWVNGANEGTINKSGGAYGTMTLTDLFRIGGDAAGLHQLFNFVEMRFASGPSVLDNFTAQRNEMETKYAV